MAVVEELSVKYPQMTGAYKSSIESIKQKVAAIFLGDKSMLAPGCQSGFNALKQAGL